MNALEIKTVVPSEVWKSYFKFTIERNPYDRIVSLFYWRGGFEKYDSVYDFLTSTKRKGLSTTDKYLINNKVAIDKIYQYEDLEGMTRDLSERFKLKVPLKLTTYKAKSNSRKEKDYRKVLDNNSKKWIEEKYSDIFERFRYEW